MFDKLQRFFTTTGELDAFDEHNANTHIVDILRVLGKYEPALLNLQGLAPSLLALPERITQANAYYFLENNSVILYDAELILSANASIPARFGSSGVTMGHEMFHSILSDKHSIKDEKLGNHTACLNSHMEKVCEVFQEGDCHSGPTTYKEDGPDMEAIQLLYKLMRNKLGNKLQETFPGTAVTNEQMFFIASSLFYCEQEDEDGRLNHPEGSSHSHAAPRVNGPLSLMKAFHESFKCKAGDRMVDVAVNREDCNAFGEPVRK